MVIIAGFPGVGKTSAYKYLVELSEKNNLNLKVSDSDSSQFSWLDKEHTKRNPNFVKDYMAHIKQCMSEKYDIVFISTHKSIMEELAKLTPDEIEGCYIYIFAPNVELKDEYKQRYIDRGSSEAFINSIMTNWESYINDLEEVSSSVSFIDFVSMPSKSYVLTFIKGISYIDKVLVSISDSLCTVYKKFNGGESICQ